VSRVARAIASLKIKCLKKFFKWNFGEYKTTFLKLLPAFFVLRFLRNALVYNEYLLKRESIKFFQLSNDAYAGKLYIQCDRLLLIALKLIDGSFPKQYLSLLRNSVIDTSTDPVSRGKCSNMILQATQQLDVDKFDATGWYQLSRGLFSLGYFRAAWVAREHSLDLSIESSLKIDASSTEIKRCLEAHLERGDLVRLSNLNEATHNVHNFSIPLNLLRKVFVKAGTDQISKHAEGKEIFELLIRDKTVALVGPGVSEGLYGDEIDSVETVFRVRFGGSEALRQKYVGSRCEIAQFNDLSVIRDAPRNSTEFGFIDNLQLIVVFCDEPNKVRDINVLDVFLDLPVYRSTATSGLVNLVAVIMNSPAKLKIYGFDFYSRLGQYDSELINFYRVNGWKFGANYSTLFRNGSLSCSLIAKSFSAHDPVSNFCFAQNLYKAGLFDIEPYGKSILELTPYQYVERLEEMLGDW
jgi:hypothetical protein